MKITEGVGVRSLACNTFEVRKVCWSFNMGIKTSDKLVNYAYWSTEHSRNTSGARTSHEYTWTHKIHHNLDLEEATTFPLIVFLWHVMRVISKWHFSQDSQVESPPISKIRILAILDAHNFLHRPLIEMRSQVNLYFSFRAFQYYVA